jgi:hypothetical protein
VGQQQRQRGERYHTARGGRTCEADHVPRGLAEIAARQREDPIGEIAGGEDVPPLARVPRGILEDVHELQAT